MNVAAGPKLAAAVTNAGGMGVIGGVGYTPEQLQQNIDDLKAQLEDKNAPFGVDLLLPKVGDSARATNYDCACASAARPKPRAAPRRSRRAQPPLVAFADAARVIYARPCWRWPLQTPRGRSMSSSTSSSSPRRASSCAPWACPPRPSSTSCTPRASRS